MTARHTAASRYQDVSAEIDAELERCGRAPGSVTLVGVAKRQKPEIVQSAIAAGLKDVAQNYLQEARAAFSLLAPVRKHFIGHLQTNKAKPIVQLFDIVQSVDRTEAARALANAAAALEKRLPVLVQLNVSPAERFGCAPGEADALVELVRAEPSLQFEGVMAIGPVTGDAGEISRAFEVAAKTFARVGGSTLSIGMSGDWRAAVRAGSTMVRLGTALFGGRDNA